MCSCRTQCIIPWQTHFTSAVDCAEDKVSAEHRHWRIAQRTCLRPMDGTSRGSRISQVLSTVVDPSAGGGRETWNLYGRLQCHLFYDLFYRTGGHGPLAPPDPLLKALLHTCPSAFNVYGAEWPWDWIGRIIPCSKQVIHEAYISEIQALTRTNQ